MANRYWVGGGSSTNWDATGSTNWSATDGGSNNATVPTTGDDVFFKSSANCAINVNTADLNSLDMTGYSGSCSTSTFLKSINIVPTGAGTTNCVLVNFSFSPTNLGRFYLKPPTGATINFYPPSDMGSGELYITAAAGKVSLQGDYYATNFLFYVAGNSGALNFESNGYSLNTMRFNFDTSVIDLTNSTITCRSGQSTPWYCGGASGVNLTIDLTGTTLNLDSSISANQYLGNKTYNIINCSGRFTTVGSATISELNLNNAGNATGLKVTSGSTLTVSTFTTNGYASNLSKIAATSAGTPFNIIKAGGGTISEDYMSIQDCAASPANTWYAGTHSTNVSGNSGWVFSGIPRARAPLPVYHRP